MSVPTEPVVVPAPWDPLPADAPFIKVDRYNPADRPPEEVWVRATIYLRGELVSEGEVPEIGLYKKENIAERSAIALALHSFAQQFSDLASSRIIRRGDGAPTSSE